MALLALSTSIGTTSASCWEEAGARYGVHPWLLATIAKVESGFDPNAVNATHVARTGSVDLGLMQINSSWLPVLARHGITRESPRVKAVVLAVDSPGGSPGEAERIYRAMESLRAEHGKPVVAVISNVGASAAYLIALHADKIYAGRYSLVGSIGAVLAGWDLHRAAERLEVSQRLYVSGPLKAMLSPFQPTSPEADAKARLLTRGLGEAFVAEVRRLRGTRLCETTDIATGEVWLGTDARTLGLVDGIGTLEEVIRKEWNLASYDFGPRRGGGLISMEVAADFVRGVVDHTFPRLDPRFR